MLAARLGVKSAHGQLCAP